MNNSIPNPAITIALQFSETANSRLEHILQHTKLKNKVEVIQCALTVYDILTTCCPDKKCVVELANGNRLEVNLTPKL